MSDLRELYQEVILDHSKNPRNKRKIEGANRVLEGYNPLCGDRFTVYLQIKDDVLEDISFEGTGCAISTASISMMTEELIGKPKDIAESVIERFFELLTGDPSDTDINPLGFGKLAAFGGVREFPVRVKCATLPWHTLQAAMEGKEDSVSTE